MTGTYTDDSITFDEASVVRCLLLYHLAVAIGAQAPVEQCWPRPHLDRVAAHYYASTPPASDR